MDEMKQFTRKRHADYSLWCRTFQKTECDYKVSLGWHQNGGRTQASGALGGGDPDKKPNG